MLDVRFELESFQPINLESLQEGPEVLSENIVEAIHLFNKALDDVQARNEDIAIIALKKAVSLHPGFYEAMNLLGICYMAVGREESAKAAFKKVMEADDCGIKALQLLNKIDGTGDDRPGNVNTQVKKAGRSDKPAKAAPAKQAKPANTVKPVKGKSLFASWLAKGLEREDSGIYGLKYIVGILIGALVVAMIWYMVPTDKSLFTIKREENIIKDPELLNEIEQLNERIKKLEQDIQIRKEENLKLMDDFQAYRDWIKRFEQAENEFEAGNYLQSADLLSNTQGMTIPEDLSDQYKQIWDKVKVKAADQLYKEGNNIYNGNRTKDSATYRQALVKYENALAFLEDEKVSYKAALYYQAGKSAARCDEIDRAVELFEAITREYPDSQYNSYALTRLREIQEGKTITGS